MDNNVHIVSYHIPVEILSLILPHSLSFSPLSPNSILSLSLSLYLSLNSASGNEPASSSSAYIEPFSQLTPTYIRATKPTVKHWQWASQCIFPRVRQRSLAKPRPFFFVKQRTRLIFKAAPHVSSRSVPWAAKWCSSLAVGSDKMAAVVADLVFSCTTTSRASFGGWMKMIYDLACRNLYKTRYLFFGQHFRQD